MGAIGVRSGWKRGPSLVVPSVARDDNRSRATGMMMMMIGVGGTFGMAQNYQAVGVPIRRRSEKWRDMLVQAEVEMKAVEV